MSANPAHWGGSEELWSATAAVLADGGHAVSAWKPVIDPQLKRIRALLERGVRLHDPALPVRFWRVKNQLGRLVPRVSPDWFDHLRRTILDEQPDLVVISQGVNFDGCPHAAVCRELGVPYALIGHKADDMYWPVDSQRTTMIAAYTDACATFFVSRHSWRLTEEQLGFALPAASIVRNPFQVAWGTQSAWPSERAGWRLACVGRLDPREKGQALLLRVLANPKWRERPIRVTFYGNGKHTAGLEAMAAFLRLDSVEFAGFTHSPESIWRTHHALVLPSCCEGLPLVEVEAMLSGRVVITTDIGGNGEILDDGHTGFLAVAPTIADLDATMERAWIRRGEWAAIGAAAHSAIREHVPCDPAATFAGTVLEVLEVRKPTRSRE